jgi:hypothetical protein
MVLLYRSTHLYPDSLISFVGTRRSLVNQSSGNEREGVLVTLRSQRIDFVFVQVVSFAVLFCGCGGGPRWENNVNGVWQ